MRMKDLFFILITLCIALAFEFFILPQISGGGVLLAVIVGGPLRDFKWGGLTLRPTKDSGAEVKLSRFEFENSLSPNDDLYATGTSVVGYVQQECAMTAEEFKSLIDLQDGDTRSGVATMPNGDILSVNGALEGEHMLSDGKVTVKIAGKVKLQ